MLSTDHECLRTLRWSIMLIATYHVKSFLWGDHALVRKSVRQMHLLWTKPRRIQLVSKVIVPVLQCSWMNTFCKYIYTKKKTDLVCWCRWRAVEMLCLDSEWNRWEPVNLSECQTDKALFAESLTDCQRWKGKSKLADHRKVNPRAFPQQRKFSLASISSKVRVFSILP